MKVAKKLEDENIHGAKAASIAREVGMTLKEYTTLLSYFEPVRRLDTPAPNNEDATLKDSLRDGYDHLEDVELNIYRLELRKDLERLMDSELTLEEREITKEYYGWDLPPMTMVRIAKERGTTPDRVRRVLATGLKKMRRFKGRLVLRHPEMTHHQQLRVRDERYRGIVRQLFEFYANSGDPVDWSGHFAVLEEVTPAYFTLLIAGNRYYVPIRSLVDVQIKDEKIQRIWLDVIYRD